MVFHEPRTDVELRVDIENFVVTRERRHRVYSRLPHRNFCETRKILLRDTTERNQLMSDHALKFFHSWWFFRSWRGGFFLFSLLPSPRLHGGKFSFCVVCQKFRSPSRFFFWLDSTGTWRCLLLKFLRCETIFVSWRWKSCRYIRFCENCT